MRKFVAGIFISIAVAAISQDRGAEMSASGSPLSDFSSLEPFVRGLAMATREVRVYRVRTAILPSHRHPKPVVIVWTKEGIVAEQKSGETSTIRKVSVGQVDVYPSGTVHSLRAVKGSLHFTLVEWRQNLRDPKEMPNKPGTCENVVEFPEGGFACLIRIVPGQQITIPELDVNSFSIAIDSGRVRYTAPRRQWEAQYCEGKPGYLPGYEQHTMQNLERRSLQFALIVPPPAEYK
jgi:quercetin dioxygenase-like cupin family protein